MAKIAKEKSPAAKALEAAVDRVRKAKEMLAKQDNAANKKAVETALAEAAKHASVVNRERFEDVAGTRIANAMKALQNLQNCASPRSYKFAVEDIDKAEAAVMGAAKATFAAFRAALAAPGETKAEGAKKFQF